LVTTRILVVAARMMAFAIATTAVAAFARDPQLLSAAAPDLAVVVGPRVRHPQELAQLLLQLHDPDSPRYRQYLSTDEFDERFGPARDDVAAIVSYLTEQGLTVSDVSASGFLINAHGTIDAVERTFGVNVIKHEESGQTAYAPDREPTLPPHLAATVTSIQGIENRTQLRANNTGPRIPSQESLPFTPGAIAQAYNLTPFYDAGLRGDGSRATTIAVATAFGFQRSDVSEFWRTLGIDRRPDLLEVIPVGGTAARTIDETTLDVEWAGAMAPGARILAYVGVDSYVSTFTSVYDRIVSDNRAAVMTISWGLCERTMPQTDLDQSHAIFQKAAALGISVVAASGDSGAFDCGQNVLGVNYPASDPLVTAIGGTTLAVDDSGHRVGEQAWQGSGGGTSTVWQQPTWQTGLSGWRQSADVALNADPATGYYVVNNGTWWAYGGTSLGTPIWAALLALINQYRAQHTQPTIGAAGAALCDAAMQPAAATVPFTDIVAGNNGHYTAGAGWDFPTGWGVPDAWTLAQALGAPATAHSVVGGTSIMSYLYPELSATSGTVRVTITARCSQTRGTVAVRGLSPGLYRLAIDDDPVMEFAVGASGREHAPLNGVDPRGHQVTLIDLSARVLFRGDFPFQAPPRVHMRARFDNPGRARGASGAVTYRSANGAEQFRATVNGLPAGHYQLFAGTHQIATLAVLARADGATSGAVRFDSRNLRGQACPTTLRCQPLRLRSNGIVMLELIATKPGTGICPE
jgi:kumamolisin